MNSTNPLNNLNPINEKIPLKTINQINNLVNIEESLNNKMFNENKNESTDELNLNSINQLGLVNNQNIHNNPNKNLTITEKAYTIKYTPYNTLSNSSNYIYVDDPKNVIGDCDNAIINQPITYLQLASGCITENEYDVILDSPQGLVYAFYFKEKSNFCCRNCCGRQATRPFYMYANFVPSAKEIEHRVDRNYFSIERCCGFNGLIYCCNCIRPKMRISYAKTGQYLGKIIDSCDLCNKKLEIYDNAEQLIYEIKTTCWQLGLCCGRNAETVAKIDFKIYNSGTLVGHILKIPSIADKMAQIQVDSHVGFHDASNNFIVNFPVNATSDQKFLLIIAAIKLGYQFFTENRCDCCAACNRNCCNCGNYVCTPCRLFNIICCCPCCCFPFCLFC